VSRVRKDPAYSRYVAYSRQSIRRKDPAYSRYV